MNPITGWMLGYGLNALWQTPLVFAAAWAAARLVRRSGLRNGPSMEHRVWVTALVMQGALPLCALPLGTLLRSSWGLLLVHGSSAGDRVHVTVSQGVAASEGVVQLPAIVLIGLAVAYGSLVLYFAARLGWGMWRTRAMQRQAQPMLLTGEAAQMWKDLSEAVLYPSQEPCGGRMQSTAAMTTRRATSRTPPQIAVSSLVRGPVTVGAFRGVMLVPPGFLERVVEDDLRAVMAHELAHIRRCDFMKNLTYELLSLPLAFHPMIWMTRARVAESREMVCDAIAAEAVAGPEKYARSLLRLAALLVGARPVRTLHAIGIFDANLFERRVMHLTEKRAEIKGLRRLAMAAACIAMGVATCGSAMALRMKVTAPEVSSAAAVTKPVQVPSGVIAGTSLTKVLPVYPPEAKQAKIQGAVVLHAVIGKDGSIESLQVVSGPKELQRSTLDAVRQWTYKPYLLDGEPTEVDTTVTVTYSLSN